MLPPRAAYVSPTLQVHQHHTTGDGSMLSLQVCSTFNLIFSFKSKYHSLVYTTDISNHALTSSFTSKSPKPYLLLA